MSKVQLPPTARLVPLHVSLLRAMSPEGKPGDRLNIRSSVGDESVPLLVIVNDFMMPQLITANPKWQTLPVIQYLFQNQFTTNFNVAFASYLMAMLPTLVAFLIAQRWVINGIMRGSIK